jgi:hypothetical protein
MCLLFLSEKRLPESDFLLTELVLIAVGAQA